MTKKGYISQYLDDLPPGDDTQPLIKTITADNKNKTLLNQEQTIGFCAVENISEQYLDVVQELTWGEFCFVNMKNASEGKWWYDESRIRRVRKIFSLLGYWTDEITVRYPQGLNAAVMFQAANGQGRHSEVAVFLAPCSPRKIPEKFQTKKEAPP